ncbi:hypothetical protein [Paenibacillus donghaensis]|uniref:Uncharacterized protein n=1 Tax=Paenibacillus donghaensis TaxID=414771 RepID=A0A2Z2KAX0_9BACL|nr:hypothetical protein [Paenibacillus donghaensis]ASA22657.1 hypothetical protein B9T62_18795 [Paenibacillus donghaensis]
MKIINVGNYDRESVDDKLVCENVNEYYGEAIVDFLNERFSGDHSSDLYKMVGDGHGLYVWEPWQEDTMNSPYERAEKILNNITEDELTELFEEAGFKITDGEGRIIDGNGMDVKDGLLVR